MLICFVQIFYATVLEDQNRSEIENSLLELEEHMEDVEISFNQLSNFDLIETNMSQFKLNSCKIILPKIPLFEFNVKHT